MTDQKYKSKIRAALKGEFEADVLTKALAKAERWMIAAYGAVDYEEAESEVGDLAEFVREYAEECLKEQDGVRTVNRALFGRRAGQGKKKV